MKKAIYQESYRALVATLRDTRHRQGLRQEDVAGCLGVTRTWVSKVESCELRMDMVQFVALCRVLRVDASRLVRRLAQGAA